MPRKLVRALGLGRVLDGLTDLQDTLGRGPTYLVGTHVTYGVYLETGTSKMPPYPWQSPAVEEFESDPAGFIAAHTGTSVDELETTDDVVATVALALERRMVDNVSAGKVSDRSPGTHAEHPQRPTGNLAGSIRAVRVG